MIFHFKALVSTILLITLTSTSLSKAQTSAPSKHTLSYGTGFFISEDGVVATCRHVVSGAKSISIRTADGTQFQVTNAVELEIDDIALLKIVSTNESKFKALPVLQDSNALELGEDIMTMGFPNPEIQGTNPKFGQGIVSALTGFKDKKRLIQISIPIQPGNSGGPVVNSKGNVVAMVQSSLNELLTLDKTGSIPQNVNYAIRSQSIFWAAQMIGVHTQTKNTFSRSKSAKIDAMRDAVVFITASM